MAPLKLRVDEDSPQFEKVLPCLKRHGSIEATGTANGDLLKAH